jgi:hypothetical protein
MEPSQLKQHGKYATLPLGRALRLLGDALTFYQSVAVYIASTTTLLILQELVRPQTPVTQTNLVSVFAHP